LEKLADWEEQLAAYEEANNQLKGDNNTVFCSKETKIDLANVTRTANKAWKKTELTSEQSEKWGRVKPYTPDLCVYGSGITFPLMLGEAKKGVFISDQRGSMQQELIQSMFISLTMLPRSYALYAQDNMVTVTKMTPSRGKTYKDNSLNLEEAIFTYPEQPRTDKGFTQVKIKNIAKAHSAFMGTLFDVWADILVNFNAAEQACKSLDTECSEIHNKAGFFRNKAYANKFHHNKGREKKYSAKAFLRFTPEETYSEPLPQVTSYTTRGDYFAKIYNETRKALKLKDDD